MKKVIAYIDGFNLYYSSLKGTPNKWLDLYSLCSSLLKPDQELIEVKYFSALVKDRFNKNKIVHQSIYLDALKTNPKVKIKLGFFSEHKIQLPEASSFTTGILK